MGRKTHGGARRREITTTRYFADKVSELMQRIGVSSSEAYRHIQLLAEGRQIQRLHLARLITSMKNEALAMGSECGPQAGKRVTTIVETAIEALALL